MADPVPTVFSPENEELKTEKTSLENPQFRDPVKRNKGESRERSRRPGRHQESILSRRSIQLMMDEISRGDFMAANQVVLYFDRQEDAMQFTLAASSVISAEEPVGNSEVMAKVTQEISKASRITTEGAISGR